MKFTPGRTEFRTKKRICPHVLKTKKKRTKHLYMIIKDVFFILNNKKRFLKRFISFFDQLNGEHEMMS